MLNAFSSSLVVWLGLVTPAWCEEPPKPPAEAGPAPAERPAGKMLLAQVLPAPEPAPGADSVAERITRLRRAIEADEQHLADLKSNRDAPDGEYAQAQAAFDEADQALEALRKKLAAGEPADREAAEAEAARMQKARDQAKDRFDLAIEDRKIGAEQIANLVEKLREEREALAKLEGTAPAEPATPAAAVADPAPSTPTPAPAPSPSPSPATPAADPAPSAPAAAAPAAAVPAAPVPAAAAPAAPVPAPAAPETPTPAEGLDEQGRPPSQELIKAQEDAATKAAASKEAEAAALSISERLENLDKSIVVEQKMLATGRKQRENATESRAELTKTFRERSLAAAPRTELDDLLARVHEVEERLHASTEDVKEHSLRLEELQTQRSELLAEQVASLREAELARDQVEIAQKELERLENPFSLRNILAWLILHGPRILVILAAMAVALLASKFFTERVVNLIAHGGARGSSVEREARARTLVGVLHNAVSLAVIAGGGMMVLQEAGIPIAPLLGGAAVFGLAVAFGAQNLIRDYFYGFVILLENQYKLNDVVQIGDLSGQVEKITLRMTVLRDLEGRVHFLPNGGVTAVTNFTHGWSRALFDVGVAYRENVDRVMAVLMTLAHELRSDPLYSPMILEDATMLGVDSLGDSAVVIKFYIKTRPLQQWAVKRELLRRIKNRFDELGIEIPFPHQSVYHRSPDGATIDPFDRPQGQGLILRGTHAAN